MTKRISKYVGLVLGILFISISCVDTAKSEIHGNEVIVRTNDELVDSPDSLTVIAKMYFQDVNSSNIDHLQINGGVLMGEKYTQKGLLIFEIIHNDLPQYGPVKSKTLLRFDSLRRVVTSRYYVNGMFGSGQDYQYLNDNLKRNTSWISDEHGTVEIFEHKEDSVLSKLYSFDTSAPDDTSLIYANFVVISKMSNGHRKETSFSQNKFVKYEVYDLENRLVKSENYTHDVETLNKVEYEYEDALTLPNKILYSNYKSSKQVNFKFNEGKLVTREENGFYRNYIYDSSDSLTFEKLYNQNDELVSLIKYFRYNVSVSSISLPEYSLNSFPNIYVNE